MSSLVSRRTFLRDVGMTSLLAVPSSAWADVLAKHSEQPKRFTKFRFGWIPDGRKAKSVAALGTQKLKTQLFASQLPSQIDLRPLMPDVYDQGEIGSCVANAVAAAIQYIRRKNGQSPDFVPSRLFLYYNGRRAEDNTFYDEGMGIYDCIVSIQKSGVCSEDLWPYDDTPADERTHQFPSYSRAIRRPSQDAYTFATDHRAVSCIPVQQDLDEIRAHLSAKYPIVFGFRMYQNSFIDPDTRPRSKILMPTLDDKPIGLHAVLAVGYDDSRRSVICRNSWGTHDGLKEMQDGGYFYLPYEYITHGFFASDFWVVAEASAII